MPTPDPDTRTTWGPDQIDTLAVLWGEGHSVTEIGRRMGISRNAVVGKAHRLNLLARKNPIKTLTGGDRTDHKVLPPPERPPMIREPPAAPSIAFRPIVQASTPKDAAPVFATARAAAAPSSDRPTHQRATPPAESRAVAPLPPRAYRLASCCWPIGEPGARDFRFCAAAATAGKPYCADHAEIAYLPRPARAR